MRITLKLACTAALLAVLTLAGACRPAPPLRTPSLNATGLDTEWGYPGSQARIDIQGDLAFTAVTKPEKKMDGLLRTTVTAMNLTRAGRALMEIGGCPVQIQVFRQEALSGEPVWDSFRSPHFSCPTRMKVRKLDPFEDESFVVYTRPAEVLGASLAEGRYYLAAVVRPNGFRLNVPAGEAHLTR